MRKDEKEALKLHPGHVLARRCLGHCEALPEPLHASELVSFARLAAQLTLRHIHLIIILNIRIKHISYIKYN